MTRRRQRWRRGTGSACAAAVVVLLAWWAWHHPAAAQVSPKALRPGLIASYRDDKSAAEIVQLEPTIALSLHAGEAPHLPPPLTRREQIGLLHAVSRWPRYRISLRYTRRPENL